MKGGGLTVKKERQGKSRSEEIVEDCRNLCDRNV